MKDSLAPAGDAKADDLRKAADELEKKRRELAEILNPTPAKQGMADRSASLQSQVMGAVMAIGGAGIEPVSEAARVRYDKVLPRVREFLDKVNAFYEKDVEEFKKKLEAARLSPFGTVAPFKIE